MMNAEIATSSTGDKPKKAVMNDDTPASNEGRARVDRITGALVSACALADSVGARRMRLQALDGLAALEALDA